MPPAEPPAAAAAAPDVVRLEHVAKSFGAVRALADVTLGLRPGEVLGLLGDNGAGKSTIVRILSGLHRPDRGRVLVDGEPVALRSVAHARALSVATVPQDLALVDQLSAHQNFALGRERTHRGLPFLATRAMRAETRDALDALGVRVADLDAPVGRLSGGQRQAIAVARAVASDARILLLDEPLAAMGAREGAMVLAAIERLRAQRRVSMILIVHNYTHVLQVCDRVCLLQNGRIALDRPVADTSLDELTELGVAEYRRARREILDGRPSSPNPRGA